MIYILVILQILSVFSESISTTKPQWFIIRQNTYLEEDALEPQHMNICSAGVMFKEYNTTHALYEVYNDSICTTIQTTKYVKGDFITDINDYLSKNAYYYVERYDTGDCSKEIGSYLVLPKEHCQKVQVFHVNVGWEINPQYWSYEDKIIKGCSIWATDPNYDAEKCTDKILEDKYCSTVENGKCRNLGSTNSAKYFVNYEKFDNGIDPLRLVLFFGILMLFL